MKEQIIEKLKRFDWYYMMSDDFRVYCGGEKDKKELINMMKENLTKEEAIELWNKYRPKEYTDGSNIF